MHTHTHHAHSTHHTQHTHSPPMPYSPWSCTAWENKAIGGGTAKQEGKKSKNSVSWNQLSRDQFYMHGILLLTHTHTHAHTMHIAHITHNTHTIPLCYTHHVHVLHERTRLGGGIAKQEGKNRRIQSLEINSHKINSREINSTCMAFPHTHTHTMHIAHITHSLPMTGLFVCICACMWGKVLAEWECLGLVSMGKT